MKIALVYDRVNKIGGAENILHALHQLWPSAPLYTGVYHPGSAPWAKEFDIKTSFVQKLPFASRHHEWLAWLMPTAFESLDFTDFDIVISVTSAEAKGIITKPETFHLCYLLTPTRYLWSHTHFYQKGNYATNKNFVTRKLTPIIFSWLRVWDQIAATRPDKIVAISNTTANRSRKYYNRLADKVIFPPVRDLRAKVDTTIDPPKDYYLLVSRLVPYKRVDLAVKAFNQLGKTLVVVGDGAQKKHLQKIAKENIKLIGRVSSSKLARYYQKTRGLIFPAEEDFGIVSLEAQYWGKPVIGFAKGGTAETVLPGKTGILFPCQTVKDIINAVVKLETSKISPKACQSNAKKYSVVKFKSLFKSYLEDQWQNHQRNLK